MTYCCEQMARQLQHTCEAHSDLRDCPDSLVIHLQDTGQFGLRVHDGGSSFITIRHCPWCGTDLLERVSNRERREDWSLQRLARPDSRRLDRVRGSSR